MAHGLNRVMTMGGLSEVIKRLQRGIYQGADGRLQRVCTSCARYIRILHILHGHDCDAVHSNEAGDTS